MGILLRLVLVLFGLSLLAMAGGIVVMGPEYVYTQMATILNLPTVGLASFSTPFVDSTMRFMAVFAAVFSLILLNIARDFRDNYSLIPIMMGIVILAGGARLWSIYNHQESSTLSFVVVLLEILPALLIFMLYFMAGKRDNY